MNIAIINTYDITGGAAKAAYRLNKGLNLAGINSQMLTRYKKSNDPQVVQIERNLSEDNISTQEIFSGIQVNYINNNRTAVSNTVFKIPYPGVSLIDHPVIKEADVINLHWVADFLSVESINELLNLGKPVVWTLHDQWPLTGGCHLIAGCEKFKTDCKNCPQLNDDPYNLPSIVLENKVKLLQKSNLYIVSPSQWLAGLAKESKVFIKQDVRTIPNAIEGDIYFPDDKARAKRELGIADNIFTFYFGAHHTKDKNKGLNYLLDSINYCLKNREFSNLVNNGRVMGIFAGYHNNDLEKLGVPYKSFGFIESDDELAKLYNASDLLLLPSLEENFPNLILEAFACSTPVVAFKTGGVPELVDDYETGRIVALKDIEAFGDALLELAFNKDLRYEMGKKCRERVLENYILEKQAHQYQSLFEEVLSEKIFDKEKVQELRKRASAISFLNETYDQRIFPLFKKFATEIIQRKNAIIAEINDKIVAADKLVKEKSNLIKKSGENERQLNNQLIEKQKQLSEKDKNIIKKEEIILEQKIKIGKKEEIISDQKIKIGKREEIISEQKIVLGQKERSLSEQQERLVQKDKVISEKENIIDKKSNELQRNASALSREKELLQQTNGKLNVALKEISHQKQEISNLYNSTSWKIGWGIVRVFRFFFVWMRKKSK